MYVSYLSSVAKHFIEDEDYFYQKFNVSFKYDKPNDRVQISEKIELIPPKDDNLVELNETFLLQITLDSRQHHRVITERAATIIILNDDSK